jgi:hypothetical protein
VIEKHGRQGADGGRPVLAIGLTGRGVFDPGAQSAERLVDRLDQAEDLESDGTAGWRQEHYVVAGTIEAANLGELKQQRVPGEAHENVGRRAGRDQQVLLPDVTVQLGFGPA